MMARKVLRLAQQIHHSKLLGTALFALAIFHLVIQLIVVMPRNLTVTGREDNIQVYYQAIKNVHNAQPVYRIQPNYGPDHEVEGVYIYPPTFAAILSPFSAIPFTWFVRLWYCGMFVAFWVFAWSLARMSFGDQVDLRRALIWGVILDLFPGGYAAFSVGQIEPLLWALFGIGLLGFARSLLWAADAFVKPFYIWSLLAYIGDVWSKNGLKVLLSKLMPAVAFTAVLVLAGGLICGWDSYVVWVRDVLPTLSQGNFNAGNVSLSFAVLRIARYCGWHYAGGPLPLVAHIWLTVVSIGAPLLVWRVLRRASEPLKYACMAAAAILFSPVCWTYYLPLLLPPVAILFHHRSSDLLMDAMTGK